MDFASLPRFGDAGPYWYDHDAAEAAVQFFPAHLRLTKGTCAGQPFRLEPWQADRIIRPLFGWKRHNAAEPWRCTRRYRRVYIEIPKKNGKTETAAGVALGLLIGDHELGAEGYAIASKKDQAELVFGAATTMGRWSPSLSRDLQLFKTAIYCPALNAAFKPLTGSEEGAHGRNPSFLIGDETHGWRDGALYSALATGMAARAQPVEFLITTAGKRHGFGFDLHNGMAKIAAGVVDDPETLVVIFGASFDDDWQDPKVWARVNPNLGVSVTLEYLERKAREAKDDPIARADFEKFHINRWTLIDTSYLPMERWRLNSEAPDGELWRDLPDRYRGRPAYGALDLSKTDDTTCLLWLFPPAGGDPRWGIVPRFFVPEEGMAYRSKRDHVSYDRWAATGALTATPGEEVDYAYVERQMREDAERFDAQALAFDPWRAAELVARAVEDGLPMVKFVQNIGNFAGPTAELKRMVVMGQFEHGNHPVLRWQASNLAVKTDANGNARPDKAKATGRIDGAVCLTMAVGLATNGAEPETQFVHVFEGEAA